MIIFNRGLGLVELTSLILVLLSLIVLMRPQIMHSMVTLFGI